MDGGSHPKQSINHNGVLVKKNYNIYNNIESVGFGSCFPDQT